MITLKPITILSPEMPTCIALDRIPQKKDEGYVSSNAVSLALSYYDGQKYNPIVCRAIYENSEMVGLITFAYLKSDPVFNEACYRIRPIMVDKNHQNKGIELAALELTLKEIQTKPYGEAAAVFATYNPKEDDCAKLYAAAKFTATNLTWEAADPDCTDIIVKRGIA